MKFLIDNALPPKLAKLLREAGHDASHVRDFGMQDAPDPEVMSKAKEEQRIIVSADTDFGTLLAAQKAPNPSFILFREPDLIRAEDFAALLLRTLPILQSELELGCIAVFRSNRLRVRRLPIGID